ncbi:MAG: radical SAM protein [Clostridia bacterium]|nr:radical SAM protein [Clostridia bacterium]
MKKHRNLPFFVPFAGCPHRCAFCAQEKITGHKETAESIQAELAAFDSMMANAGDLHTTENQIAFFGGSFTGIPKERMIALLKRANAYLEQGFASSIRISTRPDLIDEEMIAILKQYRVTNVELGVQSMDDEVLRLSGRGHTAAQTRASAALLVNNGFVFGGQMMLGLPGSDEEKELATAKAICDLGAKEARIYPTVVFAGTKLHQMTLQGGYHPMDDVAAAKRTVPCLETFLSRGVKVLKIGLQSSPELANAPYGPTDGSLAELAYGYLYAKEIMALAGERAVNKHLTVCLPRGELSKVTGHRRLVLKELQPVLLPRTLDLREDEALSVPRVKISIEG